MIYSDYVNAIADLLILLETITAPTSATPSTDPNFNTILPRAIEYAEQRMYRELDIMQATVEATATTTANLRTVTIPTNLIVVNSAYVVTPAGAAPTASNAKRNYLTRLSKDGINLLWPQGQVSDNNVPLYWATQNNITADVAPTPNGTYNVLFYGVARPTALSASNTSTILTTYLPDLFVACSMVFLTGYQRDFGAQSDDPRMALSWEAQYQTLKGSATDEIARAKSQSQQWDAFSDATKATGVNRGQ